MDEKFEFDKAFKYLSYMKKANVLFENSLCPRAIAFLSNEECLDSGVK